MEPETAKWLSSLAHRSPEISVCPQASSAFFISGILFKGDSMIPWVAAVSGNAFSK